MLEAVNSTGSSSSSSSNGGFTVQPAASAVQQQPQQPQQPSADGGAGLAAAPPEPPPEPFSLLKRVELAGGVLELVHWEDGRLLRVWQPPGAGCAGGRQLGSAVVHVMPTPNPNPVLLAGYSRASAAREGYPLLLLNDGQNLFDDKLSFSGVQLGQCSTHAHAPRARCSAGSLALWLAIKTLASRNGPPHDQNQPMLPQAAPGAQRRRRRR